MEYEKLTYTNERGDSLVLGVNSVYHCNVSKDVSGLTEIDNTLYTTNSMGQHGDTYVGMRINARTITASGYINERDKARAIELRRAALKILNPELKGTLTYTYKDFVKVIECRVDAPEFYKKKVLTQYDLTFKCYNPFFKDEQETKEEIASWVAAWEFPTDIEQDDKESMIFGYREESVIVDCYNKGDVKTGMRVVFSALGTIVNPVLLNVDTGEYIQINTTMQTGDLIEVNTEYGNKGVTLTRDGNTVDYFRYLDVDSTFLQLAIGDNIYRYDAGSGVDNLEVSIYYKPEYLGV